MSYPYNPATALAPRTWLPGGVDVPASSETPPDPYPTLDAGDVVVSGAGFEPANGVYSPNGTLNGRTQALNGSGLTLYWDDTAWVIAQGATVLYRSFDAEANPDPDTIPWTVVDGVAPAPTVNIVT